MALDIRDYWEMRSVHTLIFTAISPALELKRAPPILTYSGEGQNDAELGNVRSFRSDTKSSDHQENPVEAALMWRFLQVH